jgi:hypothetical protein
MSLNQKDQSYTTRIKGKITITDEELINDYIEAVHRMENK